MSDNMKHRFRRMLRILEIFLRSIFDEGYISRATVAERVLSLSVRIKGLPWTPEFFLSWYLNSYNKWNKYKMTLVNYTFK